MTDLIAVVKRSRFPYIHQGSDVFFIFFLDNQLLYKEGVRCCDYTRLLFQNTQKLQGALAVETLATKSDAKEAKCSSIESNSLKPNQSLPTKTSNISKVIIEATYSHILNAL